VREVWAHHRFSNFFLFFFSFLVSFSQILEFKFKLKFGWEFLFLNECTIPKPQYGQRYLLI
jgi:hypothetical protein